ncbi:hypothetical protein RRG08_062243, partial [Elysia crispata]
VTQPAQHHGALPSHQGNTRATKKSYNTKRVTYDHHETLSSHQGNTPDHQESPHFHQGTTSYH